MYILCPLYILAITFFFSRYYDVKACIFVTHELSYRDVLLDNLFTLPYKLKSNLYVHFWQLRWGESLVIPFLSEFYIGLHISVYSHFLHAFEEKSYESTS